MVKENKILNGFYQIWHLCEGFILLPVGHLNASANAGKLDNEPRTLQEYN